MSSKQSSSVTSGQSSATAAAAAGTPKRRKAHRHRNQLIRDITAKSRPAVMAAAQHEDSAQPDSSAVRVANFLVEFRYFKFRISLVSRRKQQSPQPLRPSQNLLLVEQSPSRQSKQATRRASAHLVVPGQSPVSTTETSGQSTEFVYFLEDLLPAITELFEIDSMPSAIYRCLVYHNDTLCHSLRISNGQSVTVESPLVPASQCKLEPASNNSPIVPGPSLTKKTKIFDQSMICLFRQPTAPLPGSRLFETVRKEVVPRQMIQIGSKPAQRLQSSDDDKSDDEDSDVDESSVRSDQLLTNDAIDSDADTDSENTSVPREEEEEEHRSFEPEENSTEQQQQSHNQSFRNRHRTSEDTAEEERRYQPRTNDRTRRSRYRRRAIDELDTDSDVNELTDSELGTEYEDKLCAILNDIHQKSLNSMIKYIRNELLLKRVHIEQRNELVSEIERVLCENHFNCRLYMFGSTKNWLGLRSSSDIDIFVRLRDRNNRSVDESLMSYNKIERVLNQIDEILTGNQVLLARLLASQSEENSSSSGPPMNGVSENVHIQVICHRHMRVPICRLKFSKSSIVAAVDKNASGSSEAKAKPPTTEEDEVGGLTVRTTNEQILQCDLNVNNALGIANTRFIRFLCKFEPRFLVLNVLLRFWSKFVAGLNRPDALSSYALTNLVLYFFQTRVPSILPPVDYFVKLSTEHRIINDWRCDFCKDMRRINYRTDNTESVIDLLIGFFRFYERFNFVGCKISTRYAKAWKLRRMANNGNGTRGRHVDRMPFVHLMDPFEQCHNLTSRMRSKKYSRMCQQFRLAAIRYEKYL